MQMHPGLQKSQGGRAERVHRAGIIPPILRMHQRFLWVLSQSRAVPGDKNLRVNRHCQNKLSPRVRAKFPTFCKWVLLSTASGSPLEQLGAVSRHGSRGWVSTGDVAVVHSLATGRREPG